jgi:hypothetical protein
MRKAGLADLLNPGDKLALVMVLLKMVVCAAAVGITLLVVFAGSERERSKRNDCECDKNFFHRLDWVSVCLPFNKYRAKVGEQAFRSKITPFFLLTSRKPYICNPTQYFG